MSDQSPKPTREERERQLRAMLRTQEGIEQVDRLLMSYYTPGTVPQPGTLMVQTILNHEYPDGQR